MNTSPTNQSQTTTRRWLSPSLFALVIVSLFLPFATVSCDNAKTSFTGAQLVTHTVPRGGIIDDDGSERDISAFVEDGGSFFAELACLAAAVGLLAGLTRIRLVSGICATVGLLATFALALMGGAAIFVEVEYRAGYWLMFLAFAVAATVSLVGALNRRRDRKLAALEGEHESAASSGRAPGAFSPGSPA